MTKQEEYKLWCELCEYIKKEIMGYSDDMKIPKFIILRLRGLASGQFMANKKQKPLASYDYKTILYTFKACKLDILSGFKNNNTKFTSEQHKFNYAMVVIENNINDMVIRLKNAKKAKEKTVNMPLDNQTHDGAEYKGKSKEMIKELEELW